MVGRKRSLKGWILSGAVIFAAMAAWADSAGVTVNSGSLLFNEGRIGNAFL